MLISAKFTDKTRQRRPFVALGLAMMGTFFLIVSVVQNPYITLVCFAVIVAGQGTFNAPFWTMTTEVLSGAATAGGIAFINSIGNLGGFIGTQVIGYLKGHSSGYGSSLVFLSGCAFVSMLLTLTLPKIKPATTIEANDSVAPV